MNNLKSCNDETLVSMYAQGCDEAFDELLDRYQSKLFNYILFLVHDQQVADDIFQDTFTKAILSMRAGKYVDSGKFGAWLTRIAHNLVLDSYRGTASTAKVLTDDDTVQAALNTVQWSVDHIESEIVYGQTLDDVRHYMALLPPSQREVLYMRYFQDRSFKEIADITGVSINTSLGRMRYALLNIKRMMNRDGFRI
ncbi:MAG: sigma-70 family RNA polymerase sigma factor [Bacteroidaceae bacterium]|nr:sigma-70 family RNA polymerase sigma factor [Bacteroidaceae bacterium]